MQTNLADFIKNTPDGAEAERILRTCVHCGFCNATCPTYQLLGNELDGPRGRIYLIKQLLEGETSGERTLTHLDRCLTCRACESTCPSGVEYARLADIGRRVAEDAGVRPWPQRLARLGLRKIFPHQGLTGLLLGIGRLLRPLLPPKLREQVPPAANPTRGAPASLAPADTPRRVVLLAGCVQQVVAPQTNEAVTRVLARLGIEAAAVPQAGCCGAISHHLSAHDEALRQMRRNIDAWLPQLDAGAEAIVYSASGCGAVIADYGYLLRDDPDYADAAARVSASARDISQMLQADEISALVRSTRADTALGLTTSDRATSDRNRDLAAIDGPIAFHPPCSLQHGLQQTGRVEDLLQAAGFELTHFADSHLCCGSAGTYSVLEPALSERLLERKLAAIEARRPRLIATANIGCQLHLARRAEVPVDHWIELVAARLE